MTSFFDQNPQYAKPMKTDKQAVADMAHQLKMDLLDQVMRRSLIAECQDCGEVTDGVIFGYCSPCMDEHLGGEAA